VELAPASLFDRSGLVGLSRLLRVGAGDGALAAGGKRLLGLAVLLSLGGAAAAAVALVRGHAVMGTTSEMSWGILIASYVFLVTTSTGVALVSALGHVFGYRVFEPIARRAMFLALVTLLLGFVCIGTELERPLLLLKLVVLSPNPASPIWWMGTLYGVYLLIVIAELYFLLVSDHRRARIFGVITVVAALTVHPTSNLGAVFGLAHSRPYWSGPLLPVYMIATALVSGAALLAVAVYLGGRFGDPRRAALEGPLLDALGRLLALFLGITVMLTVWRTITGLAGHHYHTYDVTMALLTGPLFVHFWLFEVFLGVAVPLWLLLGERRRQPGAVALAGGLSLVGLFVARSNFVYAGQMFSLRPVVGRLGERLTYSPPFKGNVSGLLAYTPSIVELSIVAGAMSAVVVAYVIGLRVLRLVEPEQGAPATRPNPEVRP